MWNVTAELEHFAPPGCADELAQGLVLVDIPAFIKQNADPCQEVGVHFNDILSPGGRMQKIPEL